MYMKCPHCKKEISKVEMNVFQDIDENFDIPKDRYLAAVCLL